MAGASTDPNTRHKGELVAVIFRSIWSSLQYLPALVLNMRYFGLTAAVTVILFASPSHGTSREVLAALIHRYQNYTCQQIATEAQATALRALELARIAPRGQKNKNSRENETIVIRWPDLSSRALNKDLTLKIKDEMLVLEEASIEKQCSIQFESQVQ
jgi:hypothetical protein